MIHMYEGFRARYLFPPALKENERLLRPTVGTGKHVKYTLWYPHNWKEVEAYQKRLEETTAPQPCSLDLLLSDFTDLDGKGLEPPFVIQQGENFIGHSHLDYKEGLGGILCVETRSKVARRGLACTGFYSDGEVKTFLVERGVDLSFVLKNCFPSSILVPEPFSPVQVSLTRYADARLYAPPVIKLLRDGKDVTGENRIEIGNFVAYKVHLSDEMVYFRRTEEPVSVVGDGIEKLAVRADVSKMCEVKPAFCLTLTEEEVHTNGCPAYMFPFHYLNVDPYYLMSISHFSRIFQELFSDTNFLPVTANAGLINPGTHGKIVCENIAQGRNLEKYFRPHEPFAFIIPVPFCDDRVDNSYNGAYKEQQTIIF